jgi:hypothetical protein
MVTVSCCLSQLFRPLSEVGMKSLYIATCIGYLWMFSRQASFTLVRLLECLSLENKNLKGLDKCELCSKYVSSQLKGLFQVSSKVETSSTFYLTWTDLNNNLKHVNCYLTLQFTGTYENSCFFRWYYWKANWKKKFLTVNAHKTSGKWSYDDICTFLKCTKSTKYYGT